MPLGPALSSPLSIEMLEAGLGALDWAGTDRQAFWDANGEAFTETVRLAIRETLDALQSGRMPPALRAELEGQLWVLWNVLPRDASSTARLAN